MTLAENGVPTDTTAPDGTLDTPQPEAAPRRRPRRLPSELSYRLEEADVDRLAAGEPEWLAADRRAAFERFGTVPIEPNQLYTTYLDLRSADLADVHPYEAAGRHDGSAAGSLPEGVAGLAAFSEGVVESLTLDTDARAAGVTLETIGGLLDSDPGAARRLLVEASVLPADDRLAQLTRAGWNQGLVLRVPPGVRLERPISVRWAAGAAGRALLTRMIVELGAGARASLIEELVPSRGGTVLDGPDAESAALFTGTLEVVLGAGADLSVASIQEFGPGVVAFQHRTARIGEGASLRWALAQLGGRLVRSRIDNHLEGDRSSVDQAEIVFGSDDQLFDLTSYTRHLARDTTGNLLSKGALLERARSYMKGLIVIERPAVGTDSFLGEFGMNLSRDARAVAIPSLEIDQPDCRRAAHSSSVGPIDETQLFYLESRGIPADEARKIIVLGFLEPVVARVPLAEAQERLRGLLEEKWSAGVLSTSTAA